MNTITIYGASDDLLEVECPDNHYIADEFGAYGPYGCTVVLEAPTGERLWVRGVFCGDRDLRNVGEGWCMSVLHVDPKPWPGLVQFGTRPDRDDDPAIRVVAPEGTTVREWTDDDRA